MAPTGRLADDETPDDRSPQSPRPLSALAGSAAAQGYPDRIIELIVPSTPGSSADILGRILADSMGLQLGQRFVVLNKAGGSSILGTAEVARAKPDGYTLMHGAAFSITVQPLTERQTGYTAELFEPICQTFKNDQVIVARPGHLQDPGRHHCSQQGQGRRPELRHPGPRHDPASVDGGAVADQQGAVQPRAVQGAGRVDPDDHRAARSISRWRR